MYNRALIARLTGFSALLALLIAGCTHSAHSAEPTGTHDHKQQASFAGYKPGEYPAVGEQVSLPPEAWKKKLTDEEFHILREHGTERAFTGDLWNHKGHGTYRCAACGAPLFKSDTKFKSGTGWPSFHTPYEQGRVAEHKDESYGMTRVEVRCARCNGHLGHVFPDGPQPTGLRYCINSASLDFEATGQVAQAAPAKEAASRAAAAKTAPAEATAPAPAK